MKTRLDLTRRPSYRPDERNQKSKTPRNSTDKTDKSPFGSFVSPYPGPFSNPHDHRSDPVDQFGDRMATVSLDDVFISIETEHFARVELPIAEAGARAPGKRHIPPGPVDAEQIKTEAGISPKEATLTMRAAHKPRDQRRACCEGLAHGAIPACEQKR